LFRNYIMATTKSKFTPKLSLNVQHEYITLKTPNGNFTTSYRGAKASGKLAAHPTAFKELDKYIHQSVKDGKIKNYGDAMETLLDPKVLSKFWAEWDEDLNVVGIGDKVTFTEKLFLKHHPNPGIVKEVKRKTAYVEFPDGKVIGFDMGFLVKV